MLCLPLPLTFGCPVFGAPLIWETSDSEDCCMKMRLTKFSPLVQLPQQPHKTRMAFFLTALCRVSALEVFLSLNHLVGRNGLVCVKRIAIVAHVSCMIHF